MSLAELVARGDPTEYEGLPTTLEVLVWAVGGFWVLVGGILLALWYARKRRAARPEVEAHAEHAHREHVAFVERLRSSGDRSPAIMRGERGRVVLYPELSGVARTTGRHRDGAGKRRLN